MADDPEIEFSPLGGRITQDGINIQIHIHRIVGRNDGWTLEVVDPASDMATVWKEVFATDLDAYRALFRAMNHGGIQQFQPQPDGTVH